MQALVDHVMVHLDSALEQERFKPLGLATGRTMEPFYGTFVQRLSAWPASRLALLKRLLACRACGRRLRQIRALPLESGLARGERLARFHGFRARCIGRSSALLELLLLPPFCARAFASAISKGASPANGSVSCKSCFSVK